MAIVATLQEEKKRFSFFGNPLFLLGTVLFTLGGGLLIFFLAPALQQEFFYWERTHLNPAASVTTERTERTLFLGGTEGGKPLDTKFGIIIPKIGANARVISDVDWQDANIYQKALQEGVAHAKGTALPGEKGNVFIFAHSGVDFGEAARYNAVFYLMNKLVVGDEIEIFYEGKVYRYRITGSKKVASDAVEYLAQDESKELLTLMTCWPAGTTFKRLIVQAERIPEVL